MEKFIEFILRKLQDNFFLRTKQGFFGITVLIYCVICKVLVPSTSTVYNNTLSIIIISLYFLFWLYFSGRLFFSPKKIKILFAIDSTKETSNHYDQITKSIRYQIDQLNLSRSIEIRKMPSDFTFTDRMKAEKYVKTQMVDLLIWGDTIEGKLQKSNIFEFKLRFTYLYRILPEPSREIFIKQIDDSLRGRYWKILDERSFADIQAVSANITEVSLFIIGICLYVRGDLEKSLEIFEKLKSLLKDKNEITFPDISIIKKQVDSYLVEGYSFIGFETREKFPSKSKAYLEKILDIKSDDSGAHLNIAQLCYTVDGDLNASKNHTDKVIDPYLKPLTNYNKAFFAIKEKNPGKMLKYYQRIKTIPSENIMDILSFLENEFSKDPENILYHFALGYINVYHGDSKIGIEELRKFIDKAENISGYEDLANNARPLLKSRTKSYIK